MCTGLGRPAASLCGTGVWGVHTPGTTEKEVHNGFRDSVSEGGCLSETAPKDRIIGAGWGCGPGLPSVDSGGGPGRGMGRGMVPMGH